MRSGTLRIGLASPRVATTREEGLATTGRFLEEAAARGARIVCFPETYLPGYRGLDFTPPPPDQPTRAVAGVHNRARAARLARRAAQFNKFRLIQLNLVPLVDTFVSVVFFTLTTATVGELAPVVAGVQLPESRVGQPALQQLTLGIGPQVTVAGRPVMSTLEAAQTRSNDPAQPLVIPPLYAVLRQKADSIRAVRSMPATESVEEGALCDALAAETWNFQSADRM